MQLASPAFHLIPLPKWSFLGHKFIPDFLWTFDLLVDFPHVYQAELNLMLKSKVHSLRLIVQVGHLIPPYFSHPVLHADLKVFVAFLLELVWVVLVLTLYLVKVFDSDESVDLICVTFQFSLHHSVVMAVRILESLFDLSYSVSFFWRILVFFLDHFKLHHVLWPLVGVRYWCRVRRWSIAWLCY